MEQLIRLTLLAAIGGCFAMFIFVSATEGLAMGVLAGLMSFGNIILPTLLAVVLHRLLTAKIGLQNDIGTVLLQGIALYVLMMVAIISWAVGEAAIFYTLTWTESKAVYGKEFAGFQPVVLAEAFLIPALHLFLKKESQPSG
ncbi:hypothetical protein [Cesiribacter andamanensis]|uniref:Uncharacterized protein n=1 Tax=Cesiribacter andamanensis AMV16 TaxID=1279009 RepID=M7N1K4_9BACT|nr:hypothetical protein [Cesiribacter andamanensis]EMR01172.1 hypothetical protein ADICEAN_03697 [Cesiribacter andamanensis AMV16]